MTMSVNPSTLWFFNRVSFILGSKRVRVKESMVEKKWDEGRFKHYTQTVMIFSSDFNFHNGLFYLSLMLSVCT